MGCVDAEVLGWEGDVEVQGTYYPRASPSKRSKMVKVTLRMMTILVAVITNHLGLTCCEVPMWPPQAQNTFTIHPFDFYINVNAAVGHWSKTFVTKSGTAVCWCCVLLSKSMLCIQRIPLLVPFRENPVISPNSPHSPALTFPSVPPCCHWIQGPLGGLFSLPTACGPKNTAYSFLWLS